MTSIATGVSKVQATSPNAGTSTSTTEASEESGPTFDEKVDAIPKNMLITGGIFGGVNTALGKLKGATWQQAAIRGAAVGGGVAVAMAASQGLALVRDGSPDMDRNLMAATYAGQGAAILIGGSLALRGSTGARLNPFGAWSAASGAAASAGETAATASALAADGSIRSGSALAKYGIDLTEQAKSGEIGRAIGVDAKVDELVTILGAKSKNNPLIVGPAGTGKTALVEELAHRINDGNVPDHLKGVRVVKIDLDAMVGGTKLRGMFEERLSAVLKEISSSDGKIIPFVDETHRLVSAGGSQNADGAGEAVKPLLARGELRLIGATTDAADEIGEIHGDPALARRFTEIAIFAPDEQQTLDIARGAAGRYEQEGLVFTDTALRKAVEVTMPIPGRNQPDKALTLLDTAATRMRIAREGKPEELRNLDASITRLRNELRIVGREPEAESVARTSVIREELTGLEARQSELSTAWTRARTVRDELRTSQQRLEKMTGDDPDVVALAARTRERIAELETEAVTLRETYPVMFATRITPEDILATPLPGTRFGSDAMQGAGPGGNDAARGASPAARRNPVGFAPQ